MAKTKVFVGMSGGVDSSVTAALLSRQGYDVTGVFMKNWTQNLPGMVCPWKEDYLDAKRVAVSLNIPLKVYDFEKQYRQKVVDYMIGEYKAGRTPNPDIMCNQEVKFKLFLKTAVSEGADLIATGHYARTTGGKLRAGKDKNKDQSYFLYRMNERAVNTTLMPIGELKKTEVRNIAKRLKLATADKKDSQGICFVGKVGIKEFLLSELGPQRRGPIIDDRGQQIGQHDGAIFYTIGQRHGLNIGGGLPQYVTHKDMAKNQVYVTTDLNAKDLWRAELKLENIHFISKQTKSKASGSGLTARLRYRGQLVNCRLRGSTLMLDEAQRGIAAGQSAVIYLGDEVLGGGVVSV